MATLNVVLSLQTVQRVFYRGTTIEFTLTCRLNDSPFTLTDATSCALDIYDPYDDLVVSGQSMTKSSTGVYGYNWTPAADAKKGRYKAIGKATEGSTNYWSDAYFMEIE